MERTLNVNDSEDAYDLCARHNSNKDRLPPAYSCNVVEAPFRTSIDCTRIGTEKNDIGYSIHDINTSSAVEMDVKAGRVYGWLQDIGCPARRAGLRVGLRLSTSILAARNYDSVLVWGGCRKETRDGQTSTVVHVASGQRSNITYSTPLTSAVDRALGPN
ncbi:hypothetical protein CPB85DRAFT_1255795 [Mucidula mucida]|nr:hypothetical protein CPB85DRAFT_1255795 [Mucidula mucida]